MLKAKLDSVRKNKKGFSLVELIIVIAIMVALIAVMAPAFVKYVQKSRDAALTSAAEDYQTACQTYIADPETTLFPANNGTITISWDEDDSTIKIEPENLGTNSDAIMTALEELSGVDDSKTLGKTELSYTITFTNDGTGAVSCKMAPTT